ncbi:MAG: hypothetical protein LAT78_14580 [Roseinatronobacter sp.]|nr:hypothetical protein [Roseinatronobacter sp.]
MQEFLDASSISQVSAAYGSSLSDPSLFMALGMEGAELSVKANLLEALANANLSEQIVSLQGLAAGGILGTIPAQAEELLASATSSDRYLRADHALSSLQNVTVSTEDHEIAANAVARVTIAQPEAKHSAIGWGSRVSADENRLLAFAVANAAVNWLSLEFDTGLFPQATVVSVQESLGQSIQGNVLPGIPVSGRADAEFRLGQGTQGGVIAGQVKDSHVSIDTVTLFTQVAGNRADNLIVTAATRIHGALASSDGATLLLAKGTSEPEVRLAGAAFALLNIQRQTGKVMGIASLTADIDLGVADFGSGSVLGSLISIANTLLRADAVANTAPNQITAQSATTIDAASVSLGNFQRNEGAVIARADAADTPGFAAMRPAFLRLSMQGMEQSRAAIDDTLFLGAAIGNRATNVISLSGTEVIGARGAAARITTVTDTLTPSVAIAADIALGNMQFSKQHARAQSVARLSAGIEIGAGVVAGSSLSLNRNFVQSLAADNEVANLVAIMARTEFDATIGLSNTQIAQGTAVEAEATQELTVSRLSGDAISGSRVELNDNVTVSDATGNDAMNQISVSAPGIIGRPENVARAVLNAPAQSEFEADFALGNVQKRSGAAPVESRATLSVAALMGAVGRYDNSVLSLAGNAAEASAVSNRARNALVLDAGMFGTTSAVIRSTQGSDAPVSAVVSLDQLLGSIDLEQALYLSVIISDNLALAQARGNDAVHILNVQASAMVHTGQSALVPKGAAKVLNATGRFAVDNVQRNAGAVSAQVSARSDTADVTPGSGGALNSTAITLRNATLVAEASGNRSDTRIVVRGQVGQGGVSMTATSHQVNTGAVTSTARATTFTNAPTGQIGHGPAATGSTSVSAIASGNSSFIQMQRH